MINSIEFIAFGDSIAFGLAQAAGLPCNAVVGRMPDAVLAAIQSTPLGFLLGRSVILSSGLSNNPDGQSYVEKQVSSLMGPGVSPIARRVIIVGVGPGVREGTNEWLAELVGRFDAERVKFAGPLTNTRFDVEPKGVHPWAYSEVIDQIERVLESNG